MLSDDDDFYHKTICSEFKLLSETFQKHNVTVNWCHIHCEFSDFA